MNQIVAAVLKYLGYAIGVTGALIIDMPAALKVLILLMMLDIIAGFSRAVVKKDVSYSVAWTGVGRKVITLIVVAVAYLIGGQIDSSLSSPLMVGVVAFYSYVEIISILTNAAAVGIPIPKFLSDALAALNPDKTSPAAPVAPVEPVPSVEGPSAATIEGPNHTTPPGAASS
jgi:toxin secretion/phage lysis holin